jgi:intracellular sulfur oxidation DsrE/DsrF family protein
MRHAAISLLLSIAFLVAAMPASAAAPDGEVDRILALDKAPPGVVFEVVTGNPDALNAVIPRVSRYAERLRARFPDLPVAVMTHGSEQFSLLASEQDSYSDLHAQVRALSGEGDVDVHVCGNHASWRNNTAEDFPDYVDVASAASAKMREYRDLGYVVVLF